MKLCSDDPNEGMGILEMELQKKQLKSKGKKKKHKATYETEILETSLTKIGWLLGLCFGEAGAQIIATNLNLEGTGDDFNPLVPGNKNMNIFGFCDIWGFNQVTEVLE